MGVVIGDGFYGLDQVRKSPNAQRHVDLDTVTSKAAKVRPVYHQDGRHITATAELICAGDVMIHVGSVLSVGYAWASLAGGELDSVEAHL